MTKKNIKISIILLLICINTAWSLIDPLDSIYYDANKRFRLNEMNPEGQEFWLCFMQNYKSDESDKSALLLELFITSEFNTKVNIEIKALNYYQTFKLEAKTVHNVKLPYLAEIKSSEVIEPGMAVHITADNPISVYGLNRRHQTTDTYLGLPTKVLGTAYSVMSYTMSSPLLPEFAVVATEDQTEVTITPAVGTLGGRRGGEPFTVNLNKGDVYQVVGKSDFKPGLKVDMTGSKIFSNKPIAVFGGHQCAYVPSPPPVVTACNHLVEQIPPLTSWGKHFFIGKFKKRSVYTWRVLANSDSTRIFMNQKFLGFLNAGKWYEDTSTTDIQIKADKPVLVAQYSQGFKNGDSIGDPCMILISPTQQFLKRYRFATPVNGEWNHFVTVVIPTKAIETIVLDNKRVDKKLFKTIGITRYSIGSILVPYGTHSIEAAMPFGMYSYGFGYGVDSFDAYGTMGGQSFIEYEAANDTLAPMVEAKSINSNYKLIVRDDREDDSGIFSFEVIGNQGFFEKIPKYSAGVPQLEVDLQPQANVPGKFIFKVTDVALNEVSYTLCYQVNPKTGQYEYMLNEGIIESCVMDEGWQIGGFFKNNFFFHNSDFTTSGEVNESVPIVPRELGHFNDAGSTGFTFGASATHRIFSRFYGTAKLSFEKFKGKLEAPDITISHYRNPENGELLRFQEGRSLELLGLNLCTDLQLEYFLSPLMYVSGGLTTNLNLSSDISYESKILSPTFVEYSKTELELIKSRFPKELGSLNALNFGGTIGIGILYPIKYNFSVFFESTYTHYFGSLIDDGDWNLSKLNLILGIKYRI
jgi:hypothetical protein